MTTQKWTHWAVGLLATAALSTAFVTAAERPADGPGAKLRERIHTRLVALGITGQQRDQMRAVLREFQPTVQPMVRQCIQQHRALRATIQATPLNEAAIRAQAAKAAAADADLAVARGRIVEKIRPILTAEQLQAVRTLEEDAYSCIDDGLARLARWIEAK